MSTFLKEEIQIQRCIAGRFQLEKVLGQGGMAIVYRAWDSVAENHVAIKVLHPFLRNNPNIVEQFRQEFIVSQRLEHPHIIRIHNLIDSPEMLALVMECHDGENLKETVQTNGGMAWQDVQKIALQILSALEVVHAHNIVHQDIKPHNILWDVASKHAKLIDFGLAKMDDSISQVHSENAMATVEYSAPEQFEDFGVDARTDLYSLAITLFELLSGTLPYRAETAAAVIQMHFEAPLPDLRVFVRSVPTYLSDILRKAMARAPEDRFQSAVEMREALLAAQPLQAIEQKHCQPWELLKNNQQSSTTSLQSYDWNVYLLSSARDNLKKMKNPAIHLMSVLDKIVSEHGLRYRLDSSHYDMIVDRFFIHQGNNFLYPLINGVSQEMAEKIRYELTKNKLNAQFFQLDLSRHHFREVRRWQRLEALRYDPDNLGFITLKVMPVATVILVFLSPFFDFLWIKAVLICAWFALIARMIFSRTLHKTAPDTWAVNPKAWAVNQELLNIHDYPLQFIAPGREDDLAAAEQEGFLKAEYADVYRELRSRRVRASYERILVDLFTRFSEPQHRAYATRIIEQATQIARRISLLEHRLENHNYLMLLEQFERVDQQIVRATDSTEAADWIQQKSFLREQLDQIDADRLEVKASGHQLFAIASQLQSS